MKKFDLTMKANDLWTIYGSFGMVKGDVYCNNNFFYAECDSCQVFSAREEDENGIVLQTGSLKNTSDNPISVYHVMSKFVFDGGEYEVYTQCNTWQNNLGINPHIGQFYMKESLLSA